jgi:hypothetical protein
MPVRFDFKLNPTKTLAESTLKVYKRSLNQIAQASSLIHEADASKPALTTAAALQANPSAVVEVIHTLSEDRKKRSALFASVFYAIGRQDLVANPAAEPLVKAFQSNYYAKGAGKVEAAAADEAGTPA